MSEVTGKKHLEYQNGTQVLRTCSKHDLDIEPVSHPLATDSKNGSNSHNCPPP